MAELQKAKYSAYLKKKRKIEEIVVCNLSFNFWWTKLELT